MKTKRSKPREKLLVLPNKVKARWVLVSPANEYWQLCTVTSTAPISVLASVSLGMGDYVACAGKLHRSGYRTLRAAKNAATLAVMLTIPLP